MWGLLRNSGRSHWIIFSAGILFGMFIFWLLDIRVATKQIIFRYVHSFEENIKPQVFHIDPKDGNHEGENFIALELAKTMRIFVFILTQPSDKLRKAYPVKNTWARRFDGHIFVSSEEDKSLPSIRAVDLESRSVLWEKTRQGIIHCYHSELEKYDYFMKADDDTFVVVENLRYILADKDPKLPFIMGRRFKKYVNQGYASGGAGYVLSRAALKLIAEGMIKEVSGCGKREGAEDVNLGMCGQIMGVKFIDSLDEHQQEVFHPLRPSYMFDKGRLNKDHWLYSYNYFPLKTGLDCCSDHTVSFHYVAPGDMYAMEFLIYHLYPYGIMRDAKQCDKYKELQEARKKKNDSDSAKSLFASIPGQ